MLTAVGVKHELRGVWCDTVIGEILSYEEDDEAVIITIHGQDNLKHKFDITSATVFNDEYSKTIVTDQIIGNRAIVYSEFNRTIFGGNYKKPAVIVTVFND